MRDLTSGRRSDYTLIHFVEIFKGECRSRDVTEDVKLIIKCVRDLTSGQRSDYTLIHFVEIFKGECRSCGLYFKSNNFGVQVSFYVKISHSFQPTCISGSAAAQR